MVKNVKRSGHGFRTSRTTASVSCSTPAASPGRHDHRYHRHAETALPTQTLEPPMFATCENHLMLRAHLLPRARTWTLRTRRADPYRARAQSVSVSAFSGQLITAVRAISS